MTYWRFASYNVLGGILWVSVCLMAGYAFGNVPIVREHFTLVVLGIIFISILPGILEYLRHRRDAARR
jgi:membrane-associated protein